LPPRRRKLEPPEGSRRRKINQPQMRVHFRLLPPSLANRQQTTNVWLITPFLLPNFAIIMKVFQSVFGQSLAPPQTSNRQDCVPTWWRRSALVSGARKALRKGPGEPIEGAQIGARTGHRVPTIPQVHLAGFRLPGAGNESIFHPPPSVLLVGLRGAPLDLLADNCWRQHRRPAPKLPPPKSLDRGARLAPPERQ